MERAGTTAVKGSARLCDLIRRPQIHYDDLAPLDPNRPSLAPAIREQVEIQLKYAGYLARQERQVEEFRREESRSLPSDLDYQSINGLRLEARQKLVGKSVPFPLDRPDGFPASVQRTSPSC